MIFFHPSEKLQADTSQITQQIDIMPSLLDYLEIKNSNPALLGQSVFGKQKNNGYALYYNNDKYFAFFKDHYIEGVLNQPFVINDHYDRPTGNASAREVEFLKAVIQYYNNGLINNDYYHFGYPVSKD